MTTQLIRTSLTLSNCIFATITFVGPILGPILHAIFSRFLQDYELNRFYQTEELGRIFSNKQEFMDLINDKTGQTEASELWKKLESRLPPRSWVRLLLLLDAYGEIPSCCYKHFEQSIRNAYKGTPRSERDDSIQYPWRNEWIQTFKDLNMGRQEVEKLI